MDASPGRNRNDRRDRPSRSDEADASSVDTGASGRPDGRRRLVGVALAVYWATLFLATHVPVPETAVKMPGADKVAHFVGYGALGLLVTLWVALRRGLSIRVALAIVLGLATYAAVDELLQIPVGRSCDLADWMWDLIGAAVGCLMIALVVRFHSRRPAT